MPAIYVNSTKVAGTPAVPVVQTTGTSTTDVMSQNAVTEALGEKQNTLTAGTGISISGGTISNTQNVPTKTSDLTNDSGYITSSYHDSAKYDASNPNGYTNNTGTVTSVAVNMNGSTKGTVTTSGTIDLGTVITAHQDISGKADKASITAGTAGTNSDTSGSSLAVPYVTMNAQGIVTGYGTHTHTVTGFGNASLTSSDFCGSEKVYNQGSTASINLSNGRIFYCTGSSITLPSAVDGVCITCIVTASSVTWGGSIVWKGNKAPTLTANVDLVSFLGYNNSWYGA